MEIPHYFRAGIHDFEIAITESAMIRRVHLGVSALVSRERGEGKWWTIYTITENDHIWKTLIDENETGLIDLEPLVKFLILEAEKFTKEQLEPLIFPTEKKARSFFEKVHRSPIRLREYPIKYPGT